MGGISDPGNLIKINTIRSEKKNNEIYEQLNLNYYVDFDLVTKMY